MTSILVSLAVEAELAPWRRLRRFRQRQPSNSAVYETTVGCTPVAVVLAGVGARRADLTAALAAEHRPGAGIVAGVAGAAKPELEPGDVLVAEAACDASENETPTEYFRSDHPPTMGTPEPGALWYRQLAGDRLFGPLSGPIR
jgi:nucleoside phosphorylase